MNQLSNSRGLSRRRFLAATGLALTAGPSILTGCATAATVKRKPASERIVVGVVGWGMQGPSNTRALMDLPDCQVVATCNIDKNHLKASTDAINKHYGNNDCKTYDDYREMMARADIDAVMLAVPDNWHALMCIEAAKRGKHIFGEKPLARTIREQQAIVRAVEQAGVTWQTGSWQRSVSNFHKAAEIVRNGMIGTVKRVEVGLPSGHNDFAKTGQFTEITEPPPELDYDKWIGPSAMEPYIKARSHKNWRWNYNIGGGQLLDWVGHHCDIAHWGLDFDNNGPSEIQGEGEFPPRDAVWNTCTKYRINLKYPNNIEMVISGGHPDIKQGTKWIGTDGWVWVNRGGFDSSNEDWNDWKSVPDEERKVKLTRSSNHFANFIECVYSGKPTITPVRTAHCSALPGHLGLISMLVGRKLKWDAASETIIGDEEATKLMGREYRAPYKLG